MAVLSTITNLYMLIIFIRILLTWFQGGVDYGGPIYFLAKITDPFLNWFRRFPLQAGFLDLSPILALAALSILNQIFAFLATTGRISIGIILAMTLSAVWAALSFVLWFGVVILALRLIGFFTNANMYGTFWRIIDAIAEPIHARIDSMFGGRMGGFRNSLIFSTVGLGVFTIVAGLVVKVLCGLLISMPV
jgi:YggT family protein